MLSGFGSIDYSLFELHLSNYLLTKLHDSFVHFGEITPKILRNQQLCWSMRHKMLPELQEEKGICRFK